MPFPFRGRIVVFGWTVAFSPPLPTGLITTRSLHARFFTITVIRARHQIAGHYSGITHHLPDGRFTGLMLRLRLFLHTPNA